jgi:isocitrate lyase
MSEPRDKNAFVKDLQRQWERSERWKGIKRRYTAEDVWRLRGSIRIEYTLARRGASRLWELLHGEPYVNSLSAVTGNQAIQHVRGRLKAIYVSGWQVAADMNNAMHMYPDQSLYPSDSVPYLIKRINNSLLQADQNHHMKGQNGVDWLAPWWPTPRPGSADPSTPSRS